MTVPAGLIVFARLLIDGSYGCSALVGLFGYVGSSADRYIVRTPCEPVLWLGLGMGKNPSTLIIQD